MIDKKYIFAAFIVVALVQLAAPAKMISDREAILEKGTEHKFRTAPIDPNDPFRGKYVWLDYKDTSIAFKKDSHWKNGETIFLTFKNDARGYSKIHTISRTKPQNTEDFLEAKVDYLVTYLEPNRMQVAFPFDRYYMDEYKAPEAEKTYTQAMRDNKKEAFALVSIKDGNAVLKDVVIDKKSIRDLVTEQQKHK